MKRVIVTIERLF